MATYGYIRVSTLRQVEEGQSLEAQERIIRGYAMMLGKDIDEVFVERGVSGSTPFAGRAEGSRLLTVATAGDIVITPKLDRMFRSASDALETLKLLQGCNVQLHMIDLGGDVINNGVSKLVFTILAAVAEAERDRTIERIKETKASMRKDNKFLGGRPPYGYRVDEANEKRLVPDERQQKFIEVMMNGAADKNPLRAIQEAVYNASRDYPPPHRPSLVTIQRVIKERLGKAAEGQRHLEADLEDDHGENV